MFHDKYALAQRLIELRVNKGITQKELGDILGVSASSISNYECMRNHYSLEIIYQLAQLYGVTTDYIFCIASDPLSPQCKQTQMQSKIDILVSENKRLSSTLEKITTLGMSVIND